MESFGARLKREREQRKITLDEIAVSTKIGTRFLLALEEEHFDQLPGGIFNKGFVRAYARHLGIDEAQAIADYVAASGTGLPESRPEEAPELAVLASHVLEAREPAGGIPWGVIAIGLLILAFGFAVWGFHSREKSARPTAVLPPAANPKSPTTAPPNATPAKPAAPEPASAAPQSSVPEAAVNNSDGAAPTAAPPSPTPNPGAFMVLIKAREDAWVTITADGKLVLEDTLAASAEKSIEATNEIVVRTGNAGALDISFNGKKLPQQGAFNQVKTLAFDPNGLRQ